MNCKQMGELLPLYAGRDLDEKRARTVSAHVQMCPTCARVASEYRDVFELTQHLAPPVFSANTYASVRRQVMQQIEDQPTASSLLPRMFSSWFRPRMAWAAASALIITFSFFALYLVANRGADVRPVANIHPALNPEQTPEAAATPQTTTPVTPPGPVKPADQNRRRIHNSVSRSPLVAAKAPTSPLRAPEISPKLRDPEPPNSSPAVDTVADEAPLRVEMQTKNPNIRIIWFSQSNSKPSLPSSKGI